MMSNRFITSAVRRQLFRQSNLLNSQNNARCFSFVFAGPRDLNTILKKELVEGKSRAEVADLWYSYHENKVSEGLDESSSSERS
jgi:hypothetical protein